MSNSQLKRMPRGQALIELVVILGVFWALIAALMIVGVVGESGIRVSQAARFSAFDCDLRPGHCRQSAAQSESVMRSGVFGEDAREILASDNVIPRRFVSLDNNQNVIESSKSISLSVDLPRVDGADKNLLQKLSDAFRSFSLKAGPTIFGLASPDQLTRSTVRAVLWESRPSTHRDSLMPRLDMTSRVAMISDSWAAADRNDFFGRVRAGESPIALMDSVTAALYIPGKDLLMPVLNLIGLESNTQAFRNSFHKADHDLPYPNTRVVTP